MQSKQRLVAFLIFKNHELFKSVTHTAKLLKIPRSTLYDQYGKQGKEWDGVVKQLNTLSEEFKEREKKAQQGYS